MSLPKQFTKDGPSGKAPGRPTADRPTSGLDRQGSFADEEGLTAKVPGEGMEDSVDPRSAFPRLSDEQCARLRGLGEVHRIRPGDVLIRAGEADYDFFLVESGAVATVEGYGKENRVTAILGRHMFLGGLSLLTGSRVILSYVVRDEGEALRIPVWRLRQLVAEEEELGNTILAACLARRSILLEIGAGVKVVGSRFSPETKRVREFFARNRMPYRWMDLEKDDEADTLLRALGIDQSQTPVVLESDNALRNPSNGELAEMLRLGARGAPPELCDVVIVGGGPAGLAAAVYGASEGLDTQAVDAVAFGGQAGTSSRIENYLGFPTGISGSELAERAGIQAAKFGARLKVCVEAIGFSHDEGHHVVRLADGDEARGRTVIVATGAQYRKLDVSNIERYEGEGVYYAATQAEARACMDKPAVIVGGGNSAGQAALFISRHAPRCQLVIRGSDLRKSMAQYLVEEIESNDQVQVMPNARVVALKGEPALEAVVVEDTVTGQARELEAKALFVFIGASPHTGWLRDHVATDDHGFLLTGSDVPTDDLVDYGGEHPLLLESSVPGVFAVGDVRSGSIKRVSAAVGEGSMAVQLVHQRLAAGWTVRSPHKDRLV